MFILLEIGCRIINHQNINIYNGRIPVMMDGGNRFPVDRFGEVIGYDINTDNIGSHRTQQHSIPAISAGLCIKCLALIILAANGTTPLVGYSFAYDNTNRLLKRRLWILC